MSKFSDAVEQEGKNFEQMLVQTKSNIKHKIDESTGTSNINTMSDIVLSPLSEAKAQLSLKTVELEKHYTQELMTIEAELNALNDKKQLLEAKRETVRCKLKEIADLRDRGANNALAVLNGNKSTTKTTKKYDLEPFLADTNDIEKAVREVHLQRDAANFNESQISSKDDDEDERYLINSIIHNDGDAAELKDFSKQMLTLF